MHAERQMSDEIYRLRDAIRESKSRVTTMLFDRQNYDPASKQWQEIDNSISEEHVEQRRNMYRISIADSKLRAAEYLKQRDTIKVLTREWHKLNNIMNAELGMQHRLTVQLNNIR